MVRTDLNLADAVSRASQLDQVALGQVFDAYFPQIYRYIRFRLGEDSLAQDFSTQVLSKWLESLTKRSQSIDNLDSWFFETANKIVNQNLSQDSQVSQRNKANQALPADIGLHSTENEAAWLSLLVRECLLQLPPEHQDMLALRFGVPLSLEETSRVTGKSISEVKGIQFEALLSLRQLLEKEA